MCVVFVDGASCVWCLWCVSRESCVVHATKYKGPHPRVSLGSQRSFRVVAVSIAAFILCRAFRSSTITTIVPIHSIAQVLFVVYSSTTNQFPEYTQSANESVDCTTPKRPVECTVFNPRQFHNERNMATVAFRPNTHIMPMMVSTTTSAANMMMHHHQHHQHQLQQQAASVTHKRPIAPASAQHPRTIAPLHPNNGQHNHQRALHQQHQQQQQSVSVHKSKTAGHGPFTKSTASKSPFHPHLAIAPYPQQPASVQRRNARERNRVKQVNNGFANLRQHIPSEVIGALATEGQSPPVGRGASKKLSKVDTLKLAVEYIRRLQDLIDETDGVEAFGATNAIPTAAVTSNLDPRRKSLGSSSSDAHHSTLFDSSSSSSSSYEYPASTTTVDTTATMMLAEQQSLVDSHDGRGVSPSPSYMSDVSSVGQRSAYAMPASGRLPPMMPALLSDRISGATDNAASSADNNNNNNNSSRIHHQSGGDRLPPSTSAAHQQQQTVYKFEPYDAAYNANDEDVLDCIEWWEQL